LAPRFLPLYGNSAHRDERTQPSAVFPMSSPRDFRAIFLFGQSGWIDRTKLRPVAACGAGLGPVQEGLRSRTWVCREKSGSRHPAGVKGYVFRLTLASKGGKIHCLARPSFAIRKLCRWPAFWKVRPGLSPRVDHTQNCRSSAVVGGPACWGGRPGSSSISGARCGPALLRCALRAPEVGVIPNRRRSAVGQPAAGWVFVVEGRPSMT